MMSKKRNFNGNANKGAIVVLVFQKGELVCDIDSIEKGERRVNFFSIIGCYS